MSDYGGPAYIPQEPDLDNAGRWEHIASDTEVKRALRGASADLTVYELPAIGKTFVVNRRLMIVVRLHALGGDTRSIEGGWVYTNVFSMLRDEQEFKELAAIKRNR
jgi:hypothetical protein